MDYTKTGYNKKNLLLPSLVNGFKLHNFEHCLHRFLAESANFCVASTNCPRGLLWILADNLRDHLRKT